MDQTRRQITKIAREAGKLAVRMMKETGIGSGEFDLLHAVRHTPGISQSEIPHKGAQHQHDDAHQHRGNAHREIGRAHV